MAVDLADLVEPLKLEVSPPGSTSFPDATDEEWTSRLANAFWNARLDGLLAGYIESDGEVTPETGTTDLPREMQQLIVFYAAFDALFVQLSATRTLLRTKAGPVEYETQNSATVLKDLFAALKGRMDRLLYFLSSTGLVTDYYIDSVAARTNSMYDQVTHWVTN